MKSSKIKAKIGQTTSKMATEHVTFIPKQEEVIPAHKNGLWMLSRSCVKYDFGKRSLHHVQRISILNID